MSRSSRADALVAAAETLDALQIDQTYVIDPFSAIDQLGLTLSIVKLGELLGAVLPQGDGGVLVTSERRPAIQRYTAAHEIGHWILHESRLRLDSDQEVFGNPSNEMEREAQLFASYFLMPPALLNRAVAAYGLRAGQVAPEDVYRISRDLDVSYEAAARRLHTDRLLSEAELRRILKFGRMRAMMRASRGLRPADGLADMWDATSDAERVNLVVEEHDEVFVGLPEQRLAGWRWLTADELGQRDLQAEPRPRPTPPERLDGEPAPVDSSGHRRIARSEDPQTIRVSQDPFDAANESHQAAAIVDDVFAVAASDDRSGTRQRRLTTRSRKPDRHGRPRPTETSELLVGGNGIRTLVVRTEAAGDWNLKLHYAHAYEPHEEPLLTYELQIDVQPSPNSAFRAKRLHSDLDTRLPGDPDDDAEFEVA